MGSSQRTCTPVPCREGEKSQRGHALSYRERVFWETVLIGVLSIEVRALLGRGRIPPLTVCLRYWTGEMTQHPRRYILRPLAGAFLVWLYAHIFHGTRGIGRTWKSPA